MFSAASIYLLHVQLEWVICTQVSTLLLREDALGLQLATTISTQVSECLKSTLLLREDAWDVQLVTKISTQSFEYLKSTLQLGEDASGPQLAAALADRTSRCDLPQT